MRIGVTGHQNIPRLAASHVRRGIDRVLARAGGNLVGLSSLAAGADQWFASAVLRSGGRLHAIIPSQAYESTFTDAKVLATYRELLAAASDAEVLPHPLPSQQAFLEAGQRVVDLADLVIAVWDGKRAQGPGGTGDIVDYARERGCDVEVVWPPGISR